MQQPFFSSGAHLCKRVVLALCLLPASLFAQLDTEADFKRTVYTNDYSFGVMLHTRGYGVNFRRQYYLDGYNRQGWELDMVNIRHEKEVNIYNPFDNSARGFVYWKLNSLYALRAGYVRSYTLLDKTDQGTVAFDLFWSSGASLGLLKPVYLEIYKEVGNGSFTLSTERYDPAVHDFNDIYGRSSFFEGFGEMSLRPGVYLKTGAVFDFNILDRRVTTLELGAILDVYSDVLPIFHIPGQNAEGLQNQRAFLQFYCTFNFGKKWN
jgi:hypothetical protein